jgi:cytochrome P450
MSTESMRIPDGPDEKYDTSVDLLIWLETNFARFGDLYRASIYGTSAYVVSDPDLADHVLRVNWQNYKKGQAIKRIGFLLGNGLMVSEGEQWKRQRRMIQPAFHEKALSNFTSVILAENLALLNQWEQAASRKQSVNITSDISSSILKITLISIFGEDYEQVAAKFNLVSEEHARTMQFAESFRPLRKTVLEIAMQRRARNVSGADFLGMLMEARDEKTGQPMSDAQLVSEIVTLVVAGHETTASTLNWAWYLLSQHPEVEEKLARELATLPANTLPALNQLLQFPYARQVIEETLRLYPAGWLMTRRAIKDDRLGEYFVPAGTEIYIAPYLIQRHPAFWRQPSRFNPERFAADQSKERHPYAMIPFSAGPRKCIGEMLARIEMQFHLIIIARRLRLTYKSETAPEMDAGVNLRSKHDFYMTPEFSRHEHEVQAAATALQN